jgi:hypothetical protein
MAIIYSYPLAEEVTNDSWVLGSEMENGLRVVRNYSVGDLASFVALTKLPKVIDNFPNDAAALDGGIAIGGLYHNNGSCKNQTSIIGNGYNI